MRRLHGLLTLQSIIIILLSLNRLSSLTLGYVAPNEFLRWVDFNNMLILPLISLIAFYLLKKLIEQQASTASSYRSLTLNLMFIAGVYLLGTSYGNHEITNYLHGRYCEPTVTESVPARLCEIIIFNDDEFSHWVFFTGFLLVNVSLLWLQIVFPQSAPLTTRDRVLLVGNGLFIAAGIFANLGFEAIGLDLYVVAALTALSLWLLRRFRSQPLVIYYSTAYSVGLLATIIVKLANTI